MGKEGNPDPQEWVHGYGTMAVTIFVISAERIDGGPVIRREKSRPNHYLLDHEPLFRYALGLS